MMSSFHSISNLFLNGDYFSEGLNFLYPFSSVSVLNKSCFSIRTCNSMSDTFIWSFFSTEKLLPSPKSYYFEITSQWFSFHRVKLLKALLWLTNRQASTCLLNKVYERKRTIAHNSRASNSETSVYFYRPIEQVVRVGCFRLSSYW